MIKTKKHIVLGVTGSIAAYKSGDIIRRLRDKGFKVTVVMTESAQRFITPLTLASLSREKVFTDLFDNLFSAESMPHIDLARDADMVLIAPATANVIGKIANGLADDLLSCVVLATKARIVIAPAMNTQMYRNVMIQENMAKLKKHKVTFINPVVGDLACGDFGEGHLADVDDIVNQVSDLLNLR